jgi:hypothetical protein
MMADQHKARLDELAQAIADENREAIHEWILGGTFTLVALPSDSEDAVEAMVVESEDFAALVAFLDDDSANDFVNAIADQLDGEEVDLFTVEGSELLSPMSEDFGLLINPESEDAIMIEPSLLQLGDADADDESDEGSSVIGTLEIQEIHGTV